MEKGIAYSPDMVAAKLARRKTETRRLLPDSLIINQEPGRYKCHGIDTDDQGTQDKPVVLFEDLRPEITPWISPIPVPYTVGDWLYTREVWRTLSIYNDLKPVDVPDDAPIWYDADGEAPAEYGKYRYARFMPKKFARFWDEVTGLRCERVQDITPEAAVAEGIEVVDHELDGSPYYRNYRFAGAEGADLGNACYRPRLSFRSLWNAVNGEDAWTRNDYVFVIQFKELSRTGYPRPEPAPYTTASTGEIAEAAAESAADTGGIAITEELQDLLDKHPGQGVAVLAAYQLGLGDLREVLATLDKPRQPGRVEGGVPGRCINDLPAPLVRILNTAVAARNLELWLPFGLQYFKGDELRMLRFIEPHLVAFLNRLYTSLAARNLFRPKDGVSALAGAKTFVEEMGDVLSLALDELNAAADPREPLAAMKMYNELNMVQALPDEVAEEELAHAA